MKTLKLLKAIKTEICNSIDMKANTCHFKNITSQRLKMMQSAANSAKMDLKIQLNTNSM